MKLAVFGLGYVGTVCAACLSARGHSVIGVDVNPSKVEVINAGHSPVLEPGLDDLVSEAVSRNLLSGTTDYTRAVAESEASLVCVGTPSKDNGALDLEHVCRVTRQVGDALREVSRYHLVVFRSTMLPGTVERHLIPHLADSSGRKPGEGFGVVMNPEFLREGTSIQDFNHPPRVVIGQLDSRSGDTLLPLYDGLEAPVCRTSIKLAEMVKYADNAFHALKIAYANEIGGICKLEGIDGRELMELFCLDQQLNLSSAYLRPGFAFGGSCLPKDLRALVYRARSRDLAVPLLESVLPSNEVHKIRAFDLIRQIGKKRIGILGLSFKTGTDDLRHSPAVDLAETLLGRGFELLIYDGNVSLSRLIGANRVYIEEEIPHIGKLMSNSIEEVREHSEVLVVTRPDPEFCAIVRDLYPNQVLIDLAGLSVQGQPNGQLCGICW